MTNKNKDNSVELSVKKAIEEMRKQNKDNLMISPSQRYQRELAIHHFSVDFRKLCLFLKKKEKKAGGLK